MEWIHWIANMPAQFSLSTRIEHWDFLLFDIMQGCQQLYSYWAEFLDMRLK